jgi:hypothetical protein
MNTKLDAKQWALAAAAVFVVLSILAFLTMRIESSMFQDLSLKPETTQDVMMLRIWNYLGRAVWSLVFVFVYTRGIGGKSAFIEGLRFGVWMGLLGAVPGFFGNLVTSGWPVGFLAFNALMGFISTLVGGITAGAIYKQKNPQS